MKDVRGQKIEMDDLVAYGADNGSTIYCGYVVRMTTCFVWISGAQGSRNKTGNARRAPERIAVIQKKSG